MSAQVPSSPAPTGGLVHMYLQSYQISTAVLQSGRARLTLPPAVPESPGNSTRHRAGTSGLFLAIRLLSWWYRIMSLSCMSFIINEVEHLFYLLVGHLASPFHEARVAVSPLFYLGCVFHTTGICAISLRIMVTSAFVAQCVRCVCLLLRMPFDEQRFLMLKWLNQFVNHIRGQYFCIV